MILSRLLLGEEITKREVIGIALSILGAVVIAMGHANLESNLYGDLLALMGSVTLATYLIAGRDLRRKMDLAPYTASVYGIAGISAGDFLSYEYPSHRVSIEGILAFPSLSGHTQWARPQFIQLCA